MTSRLIASAVLAAILLGGNVQAEPLKSGPPVGAPNNRSGFRPQFVTGPSTGQSRCPV